MRFRSGKNRPISRRLLTILAFFWIIITAGPALNFLGLDLGLFPHVHPVSAAPGNVRLGINCAYGSIGTGGAPIQTKDNNGTLQSTCPWAGDVDGDGALDPLVSDNPSTLPAGSGGGFIADILVLNLNASINAFDQTVSYDPHVLNVVLIDQSGLTFGGNVGCGANPKCTLPAALQIDNVNGQVHVAQALLGVTIGPGGTCDTIALPNCTATTQTLFRIWFDVVGAGRTSLTFSSSPSANVIYNPGTNLDIGHATTNSGLSTDAIFALINSVNSFKNGYNASWTFSPNPEVPGSPVTFTAVAACGNCTGSFSYSWDFSSQDSPTYTPKVDATGASVMITAPPPVINRATLTVRDAATPAHTVTATRRLPFALAASGPTSATQGAPSGGFGAKWLGGVVTTTSGYTGAWRFCPGTPTVKTVCDTPVSIVSQNPPSITQTSSVASVTYYLSGIYNVSISLSDTAVSQLGPAPPALTRSLAVNVTGSTPAYTVAITPSPGAQVQGQGIGFTFAVSYASAVPTSSQSSSFSYQIFFGDGTTATVSGGRNFVLLQPHIYNSPGILNVKVVARETGSNAPSKIVETGTSSVDVVQQLLSGDFTLNPSSPTPSQSTTFTATGTGGSGTYTYSWSFGDGNNGTGSSPTHTYSAAGNYNVTLKITDSFGSTFTVSHIANVATQGVSPLIIGGGVAAAIAIVAGLLLFLRRRRGTRSASPPPAPLRPGTTPPRKSYSDSSVSEMIL